MFPIGYIYISTVSTNPSTWFGGTWVQILGRFLVACGNNSQSGNAALNLSAGATGGETNHTLSAAESGVPAHAHTVPKHGHGYTNPTVKMVNHVHSNTHSHTMKHGYLWNINAGEGSTGYVLTDSDKNRGQNNMNNYTGNTGNPTTLPNLTVSGGGVTDKDAFNTNNNTTASAANAHNNLPPYLAVYMFKKTAN